MLIVHLEHNRSSKNHNYVYKLRKKQIKKKISNDMEVKVSVDTYL